MRVTKVELYSPTLEQPVQFGLGDRDPTSRYFARDIKGLDPDEIISKFYARGAVSNVPYYSLNLGPRSIVMRVVLNPQFNLDESYSDVRDDLYRTISATRTGRVDLHFKSGATTVAHIQGFISRVEALLFTKLPEVQVTIDCDDPMMRGINPVVYDDISSSNPVALVDSLSTSPHGFTMQLTYTASSPNLTIQDVPSSPDWMFKVIPSGGFLTGDVLHFSSEYSDKYLYLVRSGTTIELVDKIQPNSVWPLIFPGSNSFHFIDTTKFNFNDITYYPAYWGV